MKNLNFIKKYLMGEELEGYKIEELEDNANFMLDAINYSNDINTYNLCSDKVKNDYNFVKQVILKFKDNEHFIIKVADNFLNNNECDLECRELNIIMSKLINNVETNKYKIFSDASYFNKRLEIEIEKSKDSELESSIGMGFLIIFDKYNRSEIITKHYAELMIKEIIKDNDINFEKMLHNQFKSKEQIDKIGVNNYIIRIINSYDSMLGSYISTHLELVGSIKEEIKEVYANWDNYNSLNEKERYENMFEMVHTYLESSESKMEEIVIIYYVASELGITDKIFQYDYVDVLDYLDIDILNDMAKFETEHSLKEKLVYLNVKKIMMNQLFSSNPMTLEELVKEDKKDKSKGPFKTEIIKLPKK